MDEAKTIDGADPQDGAGPGPIPCRYCREPVHPKASKCPHCHEQLAAASRAERITKKFMGFVGIFTAALSVFYALKEGYFYIEQRQQQRAMFASYMSAADQFLKLDSLEYAEASLKQALELNPSDRQLRLKYFLLRAHNLLRDADYFGEQLPEDKFAVLPELVTDGFSLTENDFVPHDRAMLLISLARLLQYDRNWQNPDAITALFAQAHQLASGDADTAYWYGEWLMGQEATAQQGLALIKEAVQKQPDDALYIAALGRYLAKQGDYAAAFKALKHAIELGDSQHELQRIRAANEAKHSLSVALQDADAAADITGATFFGLARDERVALAEFTLQHVGHDRNLDMLSAKLFHSAGRDNRAEPLLRSVLGDYDEQSDERILALFADVLDAEKKGQEARQVRDMLDKKRERAKYEEILETGLEGQHRYKVGLKVAKQNDGEGIRVLEPYAGYPFAKAGVKAGDRLLEFAHRKVANLRSIWVPILDFSPGTDVPLTVRRGKEQLNLTVVIE